MTEGHAPGDELQAWEGYVVSLDGGTFTARLVDVTAGETLALEEAEIPLDRVPPGQRHLVAEGAYFRWAIRSLGGDETVSEIAFNTETWTAEELAEARIRGAELSAALKFSRD